MIPSTFQFFRREMISAFFDTERIMVKYSFFCSFFFDSTDHGADIRVLKIVGSQEHIFFIEGNDDADDMGFFIG